MTEACRRAAAAVAMVPARKVRLSMARILPPAAITRVCAWRASDVSFSDGGTVQSEASHDVHSHGASPEIRRGLRRRRPRSRRSRRSRSRDPRTSAPTPPSASRARRRSPSAPAAKPTSSSSPIRTSRCWGGASASRPRARSRSAARARWRSASRTSRRSPAATPASSSTTARSGSRISAAGTAPS